MCPARAHFAGWETQKLVPKPRRGGIEWAQIANCGHDKPHPRKGESYLCDRSEDLFQNGVWLGNLWSVGLNVEGYCTWFGYKPKKKKKVLSYSFYSCSSCHMLHITQFVPQIAFYWMDIANTHAGNCTTDLMFFLSFSVTAGAGKNPLKTVEPLDPQVLMRLNRQTIKWQTSACTWDTPAKGIMTLEWYNSQLSY